MNNALKAEGFESSLKLPDKVLTFVRDHPLMENSVTAAPLLVRKGVTYTKLAVMQTGVGEERRGAVLHLGTGEGRRSRDNEQGEDIKDRKYEINWLSKIMQMKKVKNFLIKDKIYCSPSMFVCVLQTVGNSTGWQ